MRRWGSRIDAARCRLVPVGLLTLLLAAAMMLGQAQGQAGADAEASRYRPGQVWSYRTRPQDQGSELIVVAIDHDPRLGTIVHVQLQGVFLAGPGAGPGAAPGRTTTIGHMPFSEAAIDRSVIALQRTAALPDFRDGYDKWRDAYDVGRAGIFTLAVDEAVDSVDQVQRR